MDTVQMICAIIMANLVGVIVATLIELFIESKKGE